MIDESDTDEEADGQFIAQGARYQHNLQENNHVRSRLLSLPADQANMAARPPRFQRGESIDNTAPNQYVKKLSLHARESS